MGEHFQLELLRLQERMRSRLRNVHDAQKALVWTVRAVRDLFRAESAAAAIARPGKTGAELVYSLPTGDEWDLDLLMAYLENRRPKIPPSRLLAPVRRRDRQWAVLALGRTEHSFDAEDLRALFAITHALTELIGRIDERRARKVRRRLEKKIADRQEPKDVIYDILHGLRALTRYDHSASLFTSPGRGEPPTLLAEQIAWEKAKSRRIGLSLELPDALIDELTDGHARWFHRKGDGPDSPWRAADGEGESPIPSLLEARSGSAPLETTMIYAPIANLDGVPSVLKISARRPGVLGAYEVRLVGEFVALTSLAVQFSVRTDSLKDEILRSERKHVLANLTRGIAHDMNNALGATLPLVQQMREEAAAGVVDMEQLSKDLETVERSLQTCRRILGGMLSIARGSRDGLGHGNLRRGIEGALSVLEDSLRRRSIDIRLDLPEELPPIRANQGDLTQLFLNLLSNARDAMPAGGELGIAVRSEPVVAAGGYGRAGNGSSGGSDGEGGAPSGDGHSGDGPSGSVMVTVSDTGSGIPADLRERIWEPFFTTKTQGHGLGLAICRSILWDIGGDMRFESRDSRGTSVHLTLPVLEPTPAETVPVETAP
ncbi:MAG: ATP-binding protein [Holophagales bacterium]|nr:ATP-binding protein [Holophagales bacterium]